MAVLLRDMMQNKEKPIKPKIFRMWFVVLIQPHLWERIQDILKKRKRTIETIVQCKLFTIRWKAKTFARGRTREKRLFQETKELLMLFHK
jgi:hypothetical protein